MKAAVIERHGGLDVLAYRDMPEPELAPGDVLVAVRAAGLNYLDVLVRRGMPGVRTIFPFISGGDIAGEIIECGPGMQWRPGDRVAINPKTPKGLLGEEVPGGFAERIAVPATHLIRLPDGLDFTRAAAIPINFGTALRMLDTAGRIQPGETILVLGASGGVGTACVQIAKARGAIVIACAGSRAKLDQLAALGADHVIDYAQEDFSRAAWAITGKRGVDVVVNFTGGDTVQPSLRALRHGGRLLNCGATAGHDVTVDLRFVWRRELAILGSTGYTTADIAAALGAVARGELSPVITHTLPLAAIAEAHALMESRAFFGKIMLIP